MTTGAPDWMTSKREIFFDQYDLLIIILLRFIIIIIVVDERLSKAF